VVSSTAQGSFGARASFASAVSSESSSAWARRLRGLVAQVNERRRVREQRPGVAPRQLGGENVAAQHVADLGIDEMRGVRGLVREASAQARGGRFS
jgi:hypothetical protein